MSHYRACSKLCPADSTLWLAIARAARRSGDLETAGKFLSLSEQLRDRPPTVELERALLRAQGGDLAEVENTRALGLLIYDKYLLLFQLSGLILLVAMIGAIVLTLRHRKDIKRQNVLHQMWRDPQKALELVDVKPGQGL